MENFDILEITGIVLGNADTNLMIIYTMSLCFNKCFPLITSSFSWNSSLLLLFWLSFIQAKLPSSSHFLYALLT